jgi:hypothetical protein
MTSPKHRPSLAEALERALGHRDSATGLVDDELADLVRLAETLEASAPEVVPSPDFRAAARQRLLVQMARSARAARQVQPMHRIRLWTARFAAGLTALSFAGAAAASASASALPGDTLYPVKQATEAVAVQLATTDSARQDILLHQADTRLDETTRLLEQGRDVDATLATARYDETVARLNVAGTSPASEAIASNLRTNEVRLSELLQTAPPPARQGLERALAATERSLGRSRPSAPIPTSGIAPAATATSEQHQADAAQDRATAEVETARPADAGEHAAGESHDSASVAPRARGVEHRAQPTLVDADTDTDTDTVVEVPDSSPLVPAVGSSSGEPRGIAVSESRAASRATPPPATSQPSQGIAPTRPKEPPATPRTEPAGGRGRN